MIIMQKKSDDNNLPNVNDHMVDQARSGLPSMIYSKEYSTNIINYLTTTRCLRSQSFLV